MLNFLSENLKFLYPVVIVGAGLLLYFLWQRKDTLLAGFSGSTTPVLSQYSRDLTKAAEDGKLDPVVGREEEIERVIQVLCRRTKNNPVLIGKSGVGKTAIAEGLASAIIDKKVPPILQLKRVLALDLTGIVAGTKYRGEFEKRLKQIADELAASNRNIILFIDEIHTLAQAGGAEGSLDADDILKPALARGELQVIGATTAEEYKQFIQNDVTLDRRLHPILVDEPTKEETIEILKGIKRKYEQFHKVKITDEAIITAVHLAEEHIKTKSFPDKATDLMD
jgi:ATP-dependent Clp protease ATP-binding subunit ClpC